MATISQKEWNRYIARLRQINDKAANEFRDLIISRGGYGNIERQKLIDYAYGLTTKYGEASAALSAQMYDAIAELSGAVVPAAVPAETAAYSEVAKTVNGIIKNTGNEDILAQGIGRLVKMAGTDTILSNAYRDRPKSKVKGSKRKHSGAQVAWIPSGDTCPFCLMLASKGWQNQTQWAANSHSEHIHANCDCTYAVRFNNNTNIEGYDPEEYEEIYKNAEGSTRQEKLNSIRRMQYQNPEVRDRINAQKRAAYANRKKETTFEKERLLRRYNNTVNLGALDAPGYIDKFKGISDVESVNDTIYKSACEILKHRNGTDYEDIHFINADTGEYIHKLTTCNIRNGVDYDEATKKAIADAHDKNINIIAIHNHPGGLPPTLDDGVSAHDNGYIKGVAVGHNFEVYTYDKTDAHYEKEQCREVHEAINEIVGLEIEFDDSIWYNALKKFGMEVIRK